MNDDIFAPETVNNSDPVSADALAAQVDALLGADPATPISDAPAQESFAPEEAQAYTAPEGYELRYVQTPQGYQPVYMPISQPAYGPEYSQPYQPVYAPQSFQPYPQSPQPAAQRRKARKSAPQVRPTGALRERPRKKPWGKILGACLLSVAVVALVVWGVVAGATALIRSFGNDRNSNMGGYYGDDYYGDDDYGDWDGMGGYHGGSFSIDANGNLIDSNGNIIGSVHNGGYFTDEGGNTVIISPFNPGIDDYSPVDPENSLYFVHADGGLNVRESPSSEGLRLATVPNGFPVYVYAFQGSWAYISYGDMSGWVDADYLSYEPVIQQKLYYVHADGGLNMRAEPTTASSRIENIPDGSQIYSLARYDDWVFTFYGGTYGWVSGDYISTSASKPTQPQQGNQGSPGSSGGYTMADIEAAMAEAREYYRSRKGKTPSGGLRGDSLTDEQVEDLYWKATNLVVGMQYFPASQFENIHGMLEISDGYGFFYQVSDPNIKSMEDWADLFYSTLTDDLACEILCGDPMFMLDGKMYISGAAMGDEGLLTQYTTRVEAEPGGYKLIMDVVNIREDYYTGATERMEWSFTAHCFKEDGVWVFDDADTPYR